MQPLDDSFDFIVVGVLVGSLVVAMVLLDGVSNSLEFFVVVSINTTGVGII